MVFLVYLLRSFIHLIFSIVLDFDLHGLQDVVKVHRELGRRILPKSQLLWRWFCMSNLMSKLLFFFVISFSSLVVSTEFMRLRIENLLNIPPSTSFWSRSTMALVYLCWGSIRLLGNYITMLDLELLVLPFSLMLLLKVLLMVALRVCAQALLVLIDVVKLLELILRALVFVAEDHTFHGQRCSLWRRITTLILRWSLEKFPLFLFDMLLLKACSVFLGSNIVDLIIEQDMILLIVVFFIGILLG